MKALVLTAESRMEIQEAPDPRPGPEDALIRVRRTAICGADINGFRGRNPLMRPPRILGHEMVGTAVHLPEGDWPVREGERVVVDPLLACGTCEECLAGHANLCARWRLLGMRDDAGAFAEYVVVRASNVLPIKASVPETLAALVEPLATTVHMVAQLGTDDIQTLAIYGAGLQGLFALCLARLRGIKDIAVVEPCPERRSIAERLGASLVLDPEEGDPAGTIRAWAGGRGADAGLEAARAGSARRSVLRAVRKRGEVALLGLHEPDYAVDFGPVVRNELRLKGSYAYTPEDFQAAKGIIERGEADLSAWTRTLPLAEGQTAFDMAAGEPTETLRIQLEVSRRERLVRADEPDANGLYNSHPGGLHSF